MIVESRKSKEFCSKQDLVGYATTCDVVPARGAPIPGIQDARRIRKEDKSVSHSYPVSVLFLAFQSIFGITHHVRVQYFGVYSANLRARIFTLLLLPKSSTGLQYVHNPWVKEAFQLSIKGLADSPEQFFYCWWYSSLRCCYSNSWLRNRQDSVRQFPNFSRDS